MNQACRNVINLQDVRIMVDEKKGTAYIRSEKNDMKKEPLNYLEACELFSGLQFTRSFEISICKNGLKTVTDFGMFEGL